MKTKFLLHGGRLKLVDPRNDAYFRELTKGLVDGDEVLFIGFARRDLAERHEVFERERQLILAQTGAKLQVINATEDDFLTQVERAKAIHITGGESPDLVATIRKHPAFIAALRGKVVGGSSAGACLFSAYYFEHSVLEVLATLPMRLKVHYGNPEFGDPVTSLDLLKQCPDDLELVTIEECAWIVREVTI